MYLNLTNDNGDNIVHPMEAGDKNALALAGLLIFHSNSIFHQKYSIVLHANYRCYVDKTRSNSSMREIIAILSYQKL